MSSTKPAPGWGDPQDHPSQPVVVRLSALSDRHLVFHADELVAEFVKARAGRLPPNAGWRLYRAIGIARATRLVGGVVFHDYHPEAGDIEISAAFDSASWCTRGSLRGILFYPLHTLGLQRCTARTAESNTAAQSFLKRLGFREEGRLRRAFDGKEDMMVYGVLLREELMKGFT
jgi:RimJ/RimL family protein N-acetyltransferase